MVYIEQKAFAVMEETAELTSRFDKKMDKLKNTRDTLKNSVLFQSQAHYRETTRESRFTGGNLLMDQKPKRRYF